MNKPDLSNRVINTQEEAILYFIETMDIEMIEVFLENHITYQDMEKVDFIFQLNNAFKQFQDAGDKFLKAYLGRCNECDKSKQGYKFVGNNSNKFMTILFDSEKGEIRDLYECSNFKTEVSDIVLNQRVFIADFEDIDYYPF